MPVRSPANTNTNTNTCLCIASCNHYHYHYHLLSGIFSQLPRRVRKRSPWRTISR